MQLRLVEELRHGKGGGSLKVPLLEESVALS